MFAQPVALLQAPRDPTRWFVVEQAGTVRVFANAAQVASVATFIDITDRVTSGGEMGLLGMAFHPDFPSDPRVYLNYTNESASGRVSRI
jgi:glucose/arabinose dehydrogenase